MLGTPTACWWREPVLSLFLRAQVTDCCSSPSGALQRHTHKACIDTHTRLSLGQLDRRRRWLARRVPLGERVRLLRLESIASLPIATTASGDR